MPSLEASSATFGLALTGDLPSSSLSKASAPGALALTGPSGTVSGAFSTFPPSSTSSPAFTNSPRRFAALLNFSCFCWKTFLHTRRCFSMLSELKLRLQSVHRTSLHSCTGVFFAGFSCWLLPSCFSSSQSQSSPACGCAGPSGIAAFLPSSASSSQPEASPACGCTGPSGMTTFWPAGAAGVRMASFSSSQPEASAPAAWPASGTLTGSASQSSSSALATGAAGETTGVSGAAS
mmetsp:Transcript_103481/g.275288  ORF Transcript_103481/g.275288 Transcript_103481/m.275288 type:complete len:235 (+) Transcript_103481:817-1521(+)